MMETTMSRNLLLCVLLAGVPISVLADLPGHWYARAGIARNWADNVTFDEALSESPDETGGTIDFDFAEAGFLSFGFAADNHWRLELEAAYRHNDTEILFFPESGLEVDPESSDEVEAFSLMVNVLRDFNVGIALRPYIGAGVGTAEVEYKVGESSINGLFVQRPRRAIIDDKSTSFAFQLIVGFTMPLSRSFDLAADYRYWQATSVELEDAMGQELDTKHVTHSAGMSLRYYPGGGARPKTPREAHPGYPKGFYLAGSFGNGLAPDAEIQNSLANFDAFDIGPVATLAAGYGLGDRWRFEVEASRRKNDAEIIDFNPEFGEDRAIGRVRADSLMANAIYRFFPRSAIAPYVGLGVGLAAADYDVDVPGETFVDDDADALAYQAIIGVDIAVSPRLTFSADYRIWMTSELKMKQPDGTPLETEHRTDTMMVGLRYALRGPR
jgi:opacity protein-like surface antigen